MVRRITDNIEFDTFEDMLSFFIDVYGSMFFHRDNWLTPRQKEFFFHLVLLSRRGIDLVSKEAVEELRKIFNSKKTDRSVWIYRDKLKKLGWLIQTRDSLVVPPAFLSNFKEVDFKLKIKYSEPNKQDSTSGSGVLSERGEGAEVLDNEPSLHGGT